MEDIVILKIGGNTIPTKAVCAAIEYLKSGKKVQLDSIGMNSVYIAVKVMIKLNGLLSEHNKKAVFIPTYKDSQNPEGMNRTIIHWEIILQ